MPRAFLFVLCSTVALGQVEPRDPFDRAMQASQQARTQRNPAEAAAQREEAQKLLDQVPAASPQWVGQVQNLAQSYQVSGRHVQARAVMEDALGRASTLPAWGPARIQLLNTLAEFWQQDGNLLKALSYREKAVAAFEATPPGAAAEPVAQPKGVQAPVAIVGIVGFAVNVGIISRSGLSSNNGYLYDQLANLYRQLGRPDAAEKATAKMRTLIQKDPSALASSYERDGQYDQALAVYQKQADAAAAKPQAGTWEVVGPLQAMAAMYERQEQLPEATAALQQAAARLDASGDAAARSQAANMQLRIAGLLQRSGQKPGAEQIYQALLNQSANEDRNFQTQVEQQYAHYLSDTGRGADASQMLKDYLANHGDLENWQQANLLIALSQIARKAGQNDLADQYQQAGMEKQRAGVPEQIQTGPLVGPELQKAQAAANQGNVDEAVRLALDAMGSAGLAQDGEQLAWQVPNLAFQLAERKAPDKAEQLYRTLFPLLEARAVDNVQPLNQALPQYVRFLMGQKNWGDAALAIDRYRDSVVAAQGADTAGMVYVRQMEIELAQTKGVRDEAEQKAEDLLAFEASLSGTTSVPYLRVTQSAANVFQSSGKIDRALALHRQMVAIADRTLPANDPQRGFLRMNAAMAFAIARQFDEAERLANEAIAVGQSLHPPRTDVFQRQAEEIQQMKANPPSHGTSSSGVSVGRLGTALAPGGWYIPTEIKLVPAPQH
jgi:hypothetical protein